jgi:hypothetical protein
MTTPETNSESRHQFDTDQERLVAQTELILASGYNPRAIITAAEILTQLPHLRVVNGELVPVHSDTERIREKLGNRAIST